jgi:MurNAc alpha-1-phosphate uridylyltransferase
MILAAGRGERMRPLTDHTPKPLLEVRGKPLMQWPLEALARGGFTEAVVNTAWLGDLIESRFGATHRADADDATPTSTIAYSHEGRDFGRALETAGGIARALPLLDDVFWVAAGDVHAPDFVFSRAAFDRFAASDRLAHLWLVPNPAHHPRGDFAVAAPRDGVTMALNDAPPGGERFTFSTLALYRRGFFEAPNCAIPAGNASGMAAPLAPMLRAAIAAGRVSAELHTGAWTDVGTPERLAALDVPA